MRATRALCAKEIAQHGRILVGVTLLLLVAWFMSGLSFSRAARSLSELERLAIFLRGPLLVGAVFLGHRLVVSEHYARTQRFLEALPVHRLHAAWVKAGLGLLVVLAWALGALLLAVQAAWGSEPLDGRFLGLLLARIAVYCLAVWGVTFLFGTFGRLRIFLAVLVVALLTVVDRVGSFDLGRFGPMALSDPERLPFDRQVVPTGALLQAAGLGLAALAGAFALLRVSDGGVVESLARRLSPRELSALFVVVMVSIFTLVVIEKQKPADPYQPPPDHLWQARGTPAPVRISHATEELRPAAEALGSALGRRLSELHELLAIAPPVPVDVVHAPEVRPRRIALAGGDAASGLVVRTNLETAPATIVDTVSDVLHIVLSVRSRGRAQREPRHWFLDGVVTHLAVHGRHSPPMLAAEVDPWLLRALAVAPSDLDVAALRAYGQLSERLGDPGAMALSASGVRVLHDRLGSDPFWALARQLLGRSPRGNLRDYLHDLRHPFEPAVAAAAGLPFAELVARWRATLTELRGRPEVARRLAAQPVGRGTLLTRFHPLRLALRLEWLSPPPPPAFCTVRHQRLAPVDLPVIEDALEEESFAVPRPPSPRAGAPAPAWGGALERPLPAGYGAGERAFIAVDCDSPVLGVPVRIFARRVTVP